MLANATNIVDHTLVLVADREPVDEITGLRARPRTHVAEALSSQHRRLQAVVNHVPLLGAKQLVKGEPRHPIVEDDVVIYAGATILGRVTIGQGAQIGGNVWLTRSIAAGTTITQAKVISETFGEGSGI